MTFMRALPLLLLLSTAAWADTITGEVDIVREPDLREGMEGNTRDVALVKAGSKTYRITDDDDVDVLEWLKRERVVLEGEASPGTAPAGTEGVGALDFKISKLLEPKFEERMSGVIWTNKPGLSGRRRVVLDDGTDCRVSGPNFLALYSLTKDLKKRRITFSAFTLKNEQGTIEKLVIMEVEATVKKDTILSDASVGVLLKIVILPLLIADPPEVHGNVKKGETVWVQRRALLGGEVKARNDKHVSGFVLMDDLDIGVLLDDEGNPVNGEGPAQGEAPAEQIQTDITDRMDAEPADRGGVIGNLGD